MNANPSQIDAGRGFAGMLGFDLEIGRFDRADIGPGVFRNDHRVDQALLFHAFLALRTGRLKLGLKLVIAQERPGQCGMSQIMPAGFPRDPGAGLERNPSAFVIPNRTGHILRIGKEPKAFGVLKRPDFDQKRQDLDRVEIDFFGLAGLDPFAWDGPFARFQIDLGPWGDQEFPKAHELIKSKPKLGKRIEPSPKGLSILARAG